MNFLSSIKWMGHKKARIGPNALEVLLVDVDMYNLLKKSGG